LSKSQDRLEAGGGRLEAGGRKAERGGDSRDVAFGVSGDILASTG